LNRKCISTFFLFLLLSFDLPDIALSQQNEVRSLIEKGNQFRIKGQYSEARQSFEQAKNVAESLNDQPAVAESLNNIGYIFYLTSDYQPALENFEQSLKLSDAIGNQKGIAQSLNNIGRVHYMEEDYDVALNYYHKSLSISESLKDSSGIADSLNHIGLVYYLIAENDKGLEYLKQSLALRETLKDDTAIASSLNNIGLVQRELGNNESAITHFKKSLSIREKQGDKAGIALLMCSLGSVEVAQGNYKEALEHYQTGIQIYQTLGNKAQMANALGTLGQIYDSQGNYRLALESYQKSLKLYEQTEQKTGVTHILNMIGNLHYAQGNSNVALDYLNKALRLEEESKDKRDIANTLVVLGDHYTREGDNEKALTYYQKSLTIAEEIQQRYLSSLLLNKIANVQAGMGNFEMAKTTLEQSLEISKQIDNKVAITGSLNSIGTIHYKQQNYVQAMDFAERSVVLAKTVGERSVLWESLSNLGKAQAALNEPDKAIRSFENAIQTIESLRVDVAGAEEDKQRFFENKLTPYHLIVDLLLHKSGSEPAALAYAERAKSRVLLEVLQSGRINIAGALTSDELDQERTLNQKLISLNREVQKAKLDQKLNDSRQKELTASLDKARLDLEQFRTNIYAAHPELKIHRGESEVITPEALNKLLSDPKEAFLEYVVTQEKTFLFVISKEENKVSVDTNVFTINVKQNELASCISNFRNQMADRKPNFRAEAAALHNLLITPASEILKTKHNLVIVPDDVLWELPFQALLSGKDRYLLEDYSLYYVPSLTVLNEMKKNRKQKQNSVAINLFAMGNPALGTKTRENVKEIFRNANLDPLPQAEKEVQELAKLYGIDQSAIYIGSNAREDRVKNEASKYHVLHFASHGLLNNATPLYSQILLAQNDAQQEDGLLEAWEILNLKLNADLVVLSACDTALGKIEKGEGMIGLTWALFVAGVPNTVVSQWTVDSSSTTELMIQFHKKLKLLLSDSTSRTPIPDALRAAALNLLKTDEYRHPFYWAPFVVIGSGELATAH
jgi:CHAT domain-containing protein/Flp pilus assembly protein TadD